MRSSQLPRIRARQITDADSEAVVNLLTSGFEVRSRHYWQRALTKLKEHPTPEGLPKFGYLLESDGEVVGVVLQIFSIVPTAAGTSTRCNISSWYVKPKFRTYASMLISQATKHRNVTYINVSPATHTVNIIEAQGFSRYCDGQFVSVPAMSSNCASGRTRIVEVDPHSTQFESSEHELLAMHKTHGCWSLWCETPIGAYPFSFMPRLLKNMVPCLQLIYCRDIREFVRCARPIGRYLLARGRPFAVIDANGPIQGLVGKYFAGTAPKYFKGPAQPQFGDLVYTEAVMFGR
jgi:hypothetical protein